LVAGSSPARPRQSTFFKIAVAESFFTVIKVLMWHRQMKRLMKVSAVSATSFQPWSMVRECPRSLMYSISVMPGVFGLDVVARPDSAAHAALACA